NRLYMVETVVSSTGAKADHRLAVKASEIEQIARTLATELQVRNIAPSSAVSESTRRWLRAVAEDLRTHNGQPRSPGTTMIVPGDRQPPIVHVLAHAMNQHLGNIGRTVFFTQPVEAQPAIQMGETPGNRAETDVVERIESLRELVEEMEAGRVEVLLILGGNPVFTA